MPELRAKEVWPQGSLSIQVHSLAMKAGVQQTITGIRMKFNRRGGDSRVRVWGAGGAATREVAQAVVGGSPDALGP